MTAPKVQTYLVVRNNYYHVVIRWYNNNKGFKQTTKSTHLRADKPNKHRAEAKRREIQKDYESKITLNDNSMLVADWFPKWYQETESDREESTNTTYKRMIDNCIAPYYREKGIKLCDLKTHDVKDFYNYKTEGGVSAQTIHRYHAIIHQSLKYAVNMEYLNSNPSDKVKLPKVEKHIANFYTEDQLIALLKAIKGTNLETPVLLAAWFGMRRGEIIGLRWSRINFEKRSLTIDGVVRDKRLDGSKTRSLYYVPHTKTAASMRTLSMPEVAITYLKNLKNEQESRKESWPTYNHEWDDFVCVRKNGDLIPLEYVTRNFPKFCLKCGLERLTLHELRHTYASLMLVEGAHIKVVQVLLGHSTYNPTANTYTHVQQKSKEPLTKKIDKIMSKVRSC